MPVQRGIMFQLQTSLSPDVDKAFSEMERRIDALQGKMRVSLGNGMGMGAGAFSGGGNGGGRRGGTNRVTGFAGGVGYGSDVDQRQVDKAIADIQRLQRAADEAQRKDEDRARKAFDLQKKRDDARKQKEAEVAHRTAMNEGRRRGKLEEKVVAKEEKHQATRQREVEREQQRANREAELGAARQREAQHRLAESLNGTLDSTMRLARGFVLLSSVSETDTQKIMRNLMEVQGVIDTVRGGVDTVRGIHGTFSAMRAAGAAGGVARGIGGAAGAVGTAGRALGTAGNIGNAVAGAGGIGRMLGMGGGMAGMMGTAASFAAPVAAFAAAAASVGVAGKVIYESLTGSAKNIDSWSMKIATAEVRVAEMLHLRDDGTRKTERMQEGLDKSRAARREQDERSNAEFRRVGAERQNRIDLAARRSEVTSYRHSVDYLKGGRIDPNGAANAELAVRRNQLAANRGEIEQGLRAARGDLANVTRGGERGPGFEGAKENVLNLERQSMELQRQELELARQQKEVDVSGARERLQLLTDQLGRQKEIHAAAVGQKRSFAARFGQLNPMQQANVIAAKRAAMQGIATDQQLDALEQHGDEQGRMAAEAMRAKRGRQAIEAAGGEIGNMEAQAERNARGNKNRIREGRDETQAELEQEHNIKMATTVDNKVAVTVNAGSDFERNLEAAFTDAIRMFMQDQNRLIEQIIQRAHQHVDQKVGDAVRGIHQRGRIAAG